MLVCLRAAITVTLDSPAKQKGWESSQLGPERIGCVRRFTDFRMVGQRLRERGREGGR